MPWPAVAERMSRTLGQQVVVEHRPAGGGGTVATRAVAKALRTATRSCSPTPGRSLSTRRSIERRLRSAQGFRADRVDRFEPSVLTLIRRCRSIRPPSLSTYAKANPNKIDGDSCLAHRAYDHRDVCENCGVRDHPRSVQRQRHRDRRSDRRPYHHDGAVDPDCRRQRQSGQAPRARRHHGQAIQADARGTDRFGIGGAGILGRHPLRPCGAGRHAAPDHRKAEPGTSCGSVVRRDAQRLAREAPSRSRARRKNMPPKSMPKRPNGRPSSKAST